MGLDMPVAQNPGALTRAQADSAPGQADAPSVQKKARKAVHQVQLGVSARRPIAGDGELTGQVYGGTRALYNPLTFAVVRVDRHQRAPARVSRCRGASTRSRIASASAPTRQWLNDLRKNWANCNGVSAPNATCPSSRSRRARSRSISTSSCRASARTCATSWSSAGSAPRAGVRADQVRFELARSLSRRRARRLRRSHDARGEPDARRRVARLAIPFALRERRLGVRDADDDGARESGRRQRGPEPRPQAAVLHDVRDRREGLGAEPRAIRRRRSSTPKCATS